MNAHTPGPWHRGKYIRIIGANSQRVAVCDNNEVTPGLYNAYLIAAAPDLLAALEALADRIDPAREAAPDCFRCLLCGLHPTKHAPTCEVKIARAAIAKARGQA